MMQPLFGGTSRLLRFMLRRDRIRLAVWLLSISVFTILMAPYFADMYPTAEARQMMAVSMEGPAMVLLFGPVYSAGNYHNGAMMSNFMLLFTGAIVAVMNIFLVARHTRQDEELGRMEIVRSLPVGRLANIAAAMLLAVGANVVLTLLIALGIPLFGIEHLDLAGSLSFAAALGAVGVFFAAATTVFCQLTANNRTALGFAFAYAGAAYLLRGIGDGGVRALTVTSPFGLMHLTEAYVRNLWWPVLLLLGAAVLLAALAFWFCAIRDLGAGLVPARPGRKRASRLLSSPIGLAVRLLRTSAISWGLVVLAVCAVFGSLFGDLETLVGESEMMAAYFAHADFTIIEEFLTLLTAMIAMTSTVPAVSFMMKLRTEEKNGHTENILARSASRPALLAGNLVLALAVSTLLVALGTVSLWALASATVTDVPGSAVFFGASLSYVPAVWVMIGLSAAFIGLLPKATGVVYGYLGYCFFALLTVMMFGLPEWLESLSVYAYIPRIPLEDASWGVTAILVGLAALLSAAGFVGYRRRDAVFY